MLTTSFLNADLLISDNTDFSDFSAELARRGLMFLGDGVHPLRDDLWQVRLELDSESGDENMYVIIDGILKCVEALPVPLRQRWDALQRRVLDLGFQAGTEPSDYTREISPEFLRRMAAANIAMAITIYSARHD